MTKHKVAYGLIALLGVTWTAPTSAQTHAHAEIREIEIVVATRLRLLVAGEAEIERLRGGIEQRFQLRSDGRRGRQYDAQRILVHVIDAKFVVQVRPGGKPGGSHVTDDIALRDARALAHARGDAREVAVPGAVARLVPQHDQISVPAPVHAGELHHAVAGGLDARAGRRCVIGPSAMSRMSPVPEPARSARPTRVENAGPLWASGRPVICLGRPTRTARPSTPCM